jgi:recombinational DNA repair protein (RecF pathway)
MHHSSDALVIHCIKHGEQSVIARLFTRQFGLISFLFKAIIRFDPLNSTTSTSLTPDICCSLKNSHKL